MERIRLDNPEFEGHNNVYLFDGDRTGLVDTGLSRPGIRDRLETGLARHGFGVEDLDVILLTHWHADHAGLAGWLQRESGATVRAHRADAALAAGDEVARAEVVSVRDRLLDEWEMPSGPRQELVAFLDAAEEMEGEPASVEPIDHGEQIRIGNEVLRAVHAPGHTAGSICFVREDGSILSGDVLLPHYTPNVGGADPRVENPLGTYLDTLEGLIEADYDRAYPGHRDPIDDPAGRGREIRDHHYERARRVLTVLDEDGPSTVWSVSSALFGSLSGVHIIHGPGEAWAHLEHLRRAGLVELTDDGYAATPIARTGLVDAFH